MASPTGSYDGKLTKYHFGIKRASEHFSAEATSLARAVRAFRVGTLFPHQYCTTRVASKVPGDRGYEQTVYLSSEPGGHVPVHVAVQGEGWVEIGQIPPVDTDLESDEVMLIATGQSLQLGAHAASGTPVTALAHATSSTGLQAAPRTELEAKRLEIDRLKGELERQRSDLNRQAIALREELERRMEQIWVIELYLGVNEEVTVLREGCPAPVDTPISVRQAVLCMDEEIAVHSWLNHPEEIGKFDHKSLADFDAWLLADPSNLAAVFPHDKGIAGLRIRRNNKDRSEWGTDIGAAFMRDQAQEADRMTYLLIKNGEQLYRLWIDVTLWPRLFASADDTQLTEHTWESDKRAAEGRQKAMLAGLVAIQGILERSTLLHPLPIHDVSVLNPDHVDAHFNLVRDGEEHVALTDGTDELVHLTWKSYRTWLQGQVKDGIRVLWIAKRSYESDALESRTGIRSLGGWPSPDEPYPVTHKVHTRRDIKGKETDIHRYSILYLPRDDVWEDYRPHQRTRRVRFEVYTEEVLPIDLISWRILEHLIRDRNQRSDYESFFAPAFHYWQLKKAETAAERPFVDLILGQCDVALDNEPERARCERLLRWWKCKVKIHRTIAVDENKAYRMIRRAFTRGDDHDNDPERLLFTTPTGAADDC